jgi:hypothetical protein
MRVLKAWLAPLRRTESLVGWGQIALAALIFLVPSAAVVAAWLAGKVTGSSAVILFLGILLLLALCALWNYVPRPRLWLELRPTTGSEIPVEDNNRQPLGHAKYFHVHVCSTTDRVCRGRMIELKEVQDGHEATIDRFKPLDLTWDGVVGLTARVEPDVPARLNIVCTESHHPALAIFCVEREWHTNPRGVTTRVSPGTYRAKVRVYTEGSSDSVDGVFEIHTPRHWQDLEVTHLKASS